MRIKGVVKDYAWGNKDFIPSLLGYEASEKPQAEYWMGTHKSGESTVDGVALSEIIGRRLPFLFKVLAIDSPLSLQCHPNKEEAKRGWAKEEEKRRRGEACSYNDDNEKAEILLALSPVTALRGFRPFEKSVEALKKYIPISYDALLSDKKDIRSLFLSLFALSREDKDKVLSELEENVKASSLPKNEGEYYTVEGLILTVLKKYSGDIGCVFPLIMNILHVKPGEAIYLQPDTIHAYVKGDGIELMTASDNVLRGGLTPKRIDLSELSSILNFGVTENAFVEKRVKGGAVEYPVPSPDFLLSAIADTAYAVPESVDAIILVTEGKAVLSENGESITLKRGETAFVEKGSSATLTVEGKVFMASEAIAQ